MIVQIPIVPALMCVCHNTVLAKPIYIHKQPSGEIDRMVIQCQSCNRYWDQRWSPDHGWDAEQRSSAVVELWQKNNFDALLSDTKAFTTLDSGKRVDYSTGARRDTDENKPRFGLIPVRPLTRLADLYTRGAVKYGDSNWQKGIPIKRYYDSMLRHAYAWASGETTEDHLAAVAWNAFAIMWTMEQIEAGKLPDELDNMKDGDSPA